MQKLLLHTCCAPCSIAIIDELKDQYDLTVYFYNPNIHPQEEYLKRKAEVIRMVEEYNNCHTREGGDPVAVLPIKMVDADYETEKWHNQVKGMEKEPEGGVRCSVCFAMRLHKAGEYAKNNDFDIFATSLTSGRNKKADVINPLGNNIAKNLGLKFLEIDWKKGGRQEKGRKMVKDRGIYRQDYCGCQFSNKF